MTKTPEERAAALLRALTLDEKIRQVTADMYFDMDDGYDSRRDGVDGRCIVARVFRYRDSGYNGICGFCHIQDVYAETECHFPSDHNAEVQKQKVRLYMESHPE